MEEARQYSALIDIHLFGWTISINEAWLLAIVCVGAFLWSGNELRRAAIQRTVSFKGRHYSRENDQTAYWLYACLWSLVFASSALGAIVWFFDLGLKS